MLWFCLYIRYNFKVKETLIEFFHKETNKFYSSILIFSSWDGIMKTSIGGTNIEEINSVLSCDFSYLWIWYKMFKKF